MARLGKLASARVTKDCANTKCPATGRIRIDRHHMGCEKMFVRHLMTTQSSQLWVQKLAARYDLFHADDIVPLCIMCHREVHVRYLTYILGITKYQGRAIRDMTEKEVTRHTNNLRKKCQSLVKSGFTVRKEIQNEHKAGTLFVNPGRA